MLANLLNRSRWQAALVLLVACGAATAQQPAAAQGGKPDAAYELDAAHFETLRNLIRPGEGESRWEQIPWLLSLYEARRRAAAEGKPILLWSAGGCCPLGGC